MTENKKLKILVIDDEMQIRKLLEMALESYGYEAALAENGKEGLMKAATIHPDLAIVDLGLPIWMAKRSLAVCVNGRLFQ